ncbi:unnamed protein product [Cylicocyclus nassatus]|uniref:TIL domain-containing protein n=1 Tax=Cylicocyclus nassatus TaxID=53992 RepID=A0AA36H3S1_CYLNA|nr:unnamed protein product [Cylicocyclus nassatus]
MYPAKHIQIDHCLKKTCQCPKGTLESGTGECVDLARCRQLRSKRQAVGPIIRNNLCTLFGIGCPPTTTARPQPCGANQRRVACGTACEPTCAIRNPPCTAQCIPNVCRCLPGYIRYVGLCIPTAACPNNPIRTSTTTPPIIIVIPPGGYPYPPIRYFGYYVPPYYPYPGYYPPYYTCPAYTTYAQCVPCERACNSNYWLCYQYCVAGCTCQQGYVRDPVSNYCVNPYYCPRLYQGIRNSALLAFKK